LTDIKQTDELDLGILEMEMYLHTNSEVSRSKAKPEQIDRNTDARDRKHYHAAVAGADYYLLLQT